ncbi:hypothetical protein CUMW_187150 [Citrus unshiu]|uniref:Ribosomal protein L17 n=1 Tax=Citrus unshiu TaxID=55188 RepID=A0A2H5Q1P3_CITUN|nr:hypothetical protein CUMW_187150 [Citrus unshiu]
MTKFRKLNRPTGHRMSMLRTMVSQLVKHERIETTAKEVRRLADNMVQLGKEGSLCAARRAAAFVRGDDVIHKLFTELAYRYKDRAGGYTRLLRSRIRVGLLTEKMSLDNQNLQFLNHHQELPWIPGQDPGLRRILHPQNRRKALMLRYDVEVIVLFKLLAQWSLLSVM